MSAVVAIILAASLETALNFGKLGARPSAGNVVTENGERQYQLIVDVALEPYENGRRDPQIDQQWFLACQSPATAPERGTSCRLTRTILDHWGKSVNLGTVAHQATHTTADKTLEILTADWPAGKLEFDVIHADRSKTHALLRLAYDKGDILLESLTASLTRDGATFELRVPAYTYTQQVPMVMKGLRSAWDQEWDALLSTFSSEDRAEAVRLGAARAEILERVVEAVRKQSLTQEQPTSPEAAKEISERLSNYGGELFVQSVTEWLAASKMSAPAQKSVVAFLQSH